MFDMIPIEDIHNAILAANEASSVTAEVGLGSQNAVALRNFRKGYKAALTVMALSFGIKLGEVGLLEDDQA